jgi:predicted DNA-binding antitoxin AbrB/MazE fold protein
LAVARLRDKVRKEEVRTMADSFDAVYENGVFRPLEPVDLVDGLRVHITLSHAVGPLTEDQVQAMLRLGERVYEGLSEEEIAEIEECFSRRDSVPTPAKED